MFSEFYYAVRVTSLDCSPMWPVMNELSLTRINMKPLINIHITRDKIDGLNLFMCYTHAIIRWVYDECIISVGHSKTDSTTSHAYLFVYQ